MRLETIALWLALGCAALGATGCAPLVVAGAGTAAGYAVTQERSTRDLLADNDIGITINNMLLAESATLFRRIAVDVTEGRVVLTGGVDSVADSVRASEIAWSAPGVVSVTNEIVPEQRASATRYANDVWITSQVRARFIANESIRSVNFTIDTHDGVVHLTGIARSAGELEAATATASRVAGVRQVVSHVLSINDPRRLAPSTRPQPISPNSSAEAFPSALRHAVLTRIPAPKQEPLA
jgi:osmotically-inducible protein OsmY